MSAIVFVGPTLAAADGRATLDALYLPPAAQGDVYRAAKRRPRAIGLVDGYFDTVPAVWHKEILWALREGIAVFGSASMGALRAAELSAFGMRGVGAVFDAFLCGALEDDDEVALVHEPAERAYRPLSVPMVDLRATLAAAASEAVVSAATERALAARAKELFFPDRTYARLVEEGPRLGLPPDELCAFAAFARTRAVSVKRKDALAMLCAMRAHLELAANEPPPRFHFEHTTYFESLQLGCESNAEGN